MKNIIKWILGTLSGLVFLWLAFWIYLTIIGSGTLIITFIAPVCFVIFPAVLFYRKVVKEERVSLGEWFFSFIVSVLGAWVIYAVILMLKDNGF